jgi:hypothetical protein
MATISPTQFWHGSSGILQMDSASLTTLSRHCHVYCRTAVWCGSRFSTNCHDLVPLRCRNKSSRIISMCYGLCATVLRLLKIAWRLFTMASRMPQDWNKSSRLPIVLNMSKSVARVCRCSKIFQDLWGTTTTAVGCHHGYIRFTPIVQVVANCGKNRDKLKPILPDLANSWPD